MDVWCQKYSVCRKLVSTDESRWEIVGWGGGGGGGHAIL